MMVPRISSNKYYKKKQKQGKTPTPTYLNLNFFFQHICIIMFIRLCHVLENRFAAISIQHELTENLCQSLHGTYITS